MLTNLPTTLDRLISFPRTKLSQTLPCLAFISNDSKLIGSELSRQRSCDSVHPDITYYHQSTTQPRRRSLDPDHSLEKPLRRHETPAIRDFHDVFQQPPTSFRLW
ncbi:hypothetical protein C1H46_000567 [Malus baccata]|uniref:Uncharacterized protein n=1 Tax=Malus baccata TaxID=106549 RepID=A0A540NSB9_MALBA|nr:hypothetical protein C1H46_000567 [Malus baccata]